MTTLEEQWAKISTYSIDFDAVIHEYPRWCDVGNAPCEGAFDALYWIMEELHGAVYILCARSDKPGHPGGIQAVAPWFRSNGFKYPVYCDLDYKGFWNRTDAVLVTNRKLPAKFYIDDRGIRHTDWVSTREKIEAILRYKGEVPLP